MSHVPYSERQSPAEQDADLQLARAEHRALLAAAIAGRAVPLTPTIDRLRALFKERSQCA